MADEGGLLQERQEIRPIRLVKPMRAATGAQCGRTEQSV